MKAPKFELEGWHGFDWTDAVKCEDGDVGRMIENVAHFELRHAGYVIGVPGAPQPVKVAGINMSGDTLVIRLRSEGGYEQIFECTVRNVWHPRMEGCSE